MKATSVPILFFSLLLLISGPAEGDTGTYKLDEYRVFLFVKEDGSADITYYQKWKVMSGHIPWITVGTPNPDYTILPGQATGAVSGIKAQNSGNWSGVKVTLNRDFEAGETFEAGFKINQRGLFSPRRKGGYRFHFIPGWYDRGAIDKLIVKVELFADLEDPSVRPEPVEETSRKFRWEEINLKPGKRLPVSITVPEGFFPGPIKTGPETGGRRKSDAPKWVIAGLIVLLGVVFAVIAIAVKRGSGGRYGRGGRLGVHGGAGGRAGCVVACACACVACACACACAGGGAAGCDRKLTRTCPLCASCTRDDCPLKGRFDS